MTAKDETMAILSLLAGAAQAGAQGVLAQAAFNLAKATEAKMKAEQHNLTNEMKEVKFIHSKTGMFD